MLGFAWWLSGADATIKIAFGFARGRMPGQRHFTCINRRATSILSYQRTKKQRIHKRLVGTIHKSPETHVIGKQDNAAPALGVCQNGGGVTDLPEVFSVDIPADKRIRIINGNFPEWVFTRVQKNVVVSVNHQFWAGVAKTNGMGDVD